MSDYRSGPRKAADELLLTDGPKSRDELIAFLMPLFNHGKVMSMVHRRLDENGDLNPRYEGRRGDDWEVGARASALQVIHNACSRRYSNGPVWVREGDMIRHRDWVAPVGWVPPTLDELSGAVAALGLTKWQWAAVIATYVAESPTPGRPSAADIVISNNNGWVSPSEFARRGYANFMTHNTVRTYLRTWMEHSGGIRPEPGQAVVIPDIPWPTKRTRKREPRDVRSAAGKPQPKPTDVERIQSSNDPVECVAILRRIIGSDAKLDAIMHVYHDTRMREQMDAAKAKKHSGNVVPIQRKAN